MGTLEGLSLGFFLVPLGLPQIHWFPQVAGLHARLLAHVTGAGPVSPTSEPGGGLTLGVLFRLVWLDGFHSFHSSWVSFVGNIPLV